MNRRLVIVVLSTLSLFAIPAVDAATPWWRTCTMYKYQTIYQRYIFGPDCDYGYCGFSWNHLRRECFTECDFGTGHPLRDLSTCTFYVPGRWWSPFDTYATADVSWDEVCEEVQIIPCPPTPEFQGANTRPLGPRRTLRARSEGEAGAAARCVDKGSKAISFEPFLYGRGRT